MKRPSPLVRTGILVLFIAVAGTLVLIQLRTPHRTASTLPKIAELPSFSLTTEFAKSFTKEQLLDNVTIVDFIFTNCGGPCPFMSAVMKRLQDTLVQHPGINLLSVSVDPETDTPQALYDYARTFGADSSRWTFLTGKKSEIYDLTKKGFLLPLEEDEGAIAHSTKFVLVDRKARIRGYYESEDDSSMHVLLSHAIELQEE